MIPTRTRTVRTALVAASFIACIALAAAPSATADDLVVKQSRSGICHCPGGDSYEAVTRFKAFETIEACLEADGRHPKRGQGECAPPVAAAIDPTQLQNLQLLVDAQRAQLADAIATQGSLEATIANLRAELEAERGKSRGWWQRATRAEDAIGAAEDGRDRALAAARGANADAAAALAEAEEARSIAEDAEARARGIGPRVDRRCKDAVKKIVNGKTGWLSDSVKVDEEGRAALNEACLTP